MNRNKSKVKILKNNQKIIKQNNQRPNKKISKKLQIKKNQKLLRNLNNWFQVNKWKLFLDPKLGYWTYTQKEYEGYYK